MARPQTSFLSSMCRSCRKSYQTNSRRTVSTTSTPQEQQRQTSRLAQRFGVGVKEDRAPRASVDYSESFQESAQSNNSIRHAWKYHARQVDKPTEPQESSGSSNPYQDEPYHLNVYAHRHNTHITFTEPSRNPIISFSCGNLGLRNAQKASYDASFQLAAYTFRKMAEKQWKLGGVNSKGSWLTLSSIRRPGYSQTGVGAGIEVIMRGYGPGREAFQKALLGTEGRMIKPLISKVTDGTRLKFGGTRSPQVRRLG